MFPPHKQSLMDSQLLTGRRVLVVEDEMMVLMAIEDLLADLGCSSISVAATIDTALDLIETQWFDVATLDVNLNGQRSYPIANALDEHGVPFAFSTGYGEPGVEEGHGGHLVLKQPYTCSRFNETIQALLLERRLPLAPA